MIDVDVGLDDAAHVVGVATLARRDHGETPEAVADRQVRVGREQRLEHVDRARDAGDEPRGVVLVVEGVGRSAHGHEQVRDRHVVLGDGVQQRRPARRVLGLEVGPGPKREGAEIGLAVLCRLDQGRVGIGHVAAPGAGDEQRLLCLEALLTRHLQRGQALLARGTIELNSPSHEHPKGRGIGLVVLAEPDRLVDRLVADPVDVVTVDARAEQFADHEGVATLGGADQAGAVPGVLVVDDGAVGERRRSRSR